MERLTQDLARRAWSHIQEIEDLGGMAKALESGMPKMRIEEAAARRQAHIDSGAETIIGVNKYRPAHDTPLAYREVNNSAVRQAQIERLRQLRAERDEPACTKRALHALADCAASGQGNLLALSVAAARARATNGEISLALEKVWGRHKAAVTSITGVYSSEFGEAQDVATVRQLTDDFALSEGRRPRLMVAKMGQDGHDRGAKVIATAFADLGFDVDIAPLFQTPAEVAKGAVENDVHIVGISSLAAGHKTLLPQLVDELGKLRRADMMVVIGGVIPAQDHPFLREQGASAIFGPGTVIPAAAQQVLEELNRRLTAT